MTEWLPLPELPPPAGAADCAFCQPSRLHGRVIWAEGNPEAPVMVILDNPGAREDRQGSPFVCGTRQTLRQAAGNAGLGPDHLYVTWVLKCRPLRAYDKETARAACLPYLAKQAETVAPRVILLMGNVALQAVLGDPTAEVKRLRGQKLDCTGSPILAAISSPVICSYHPLAARRRPNLLPYLEDDLRLAARIAFKT